MPLSILSSSTATLLLTLSGLFNRLSPSYGFSYLSTKHHILDRKTTYKVAKKFSLLIKFDSSDFLDESSPIRTSEEQCNTGYEYSRCLRPVSTVEGRSEKQQQVSTQNMTRWRVYLSTLKYNAQQLLFLRRRGGSNLGERRHQRRKKLRTRMKTKPGTLILVRGGESEYAKNYTFTGWADPNLCIDGRQQMEHAGRLLLESGYEPDVIYTSRLKRAIQSVWIIAQEISAPFLPVYKSWKLNDRHYGTLTGLCKKETSKRFGVDQVQMWRSSLTARPPQAKPTDLYHPKNDRRYSDLTPEQIPLGESVLDCMERTRSLWNSKIRKDLNMGNNVMVVAHLNALRGLVKIIDEIEDDDIAEVSFPNGIPFVYKFDVCMNAIKLASYENHNGLTSGLFLEKPDLLKKAMSIQKKWETHIPGVTTNDEKETDRPDYMPSMTTLEKGLLKLKEEQNQWSRFLEDDKMKLEEDNSADLLLMMGDHARDTNVGDRDEAITSNLEIKSTADRFEENSNTNNQAKEIKTTSTNQIDPMKEPVVVLVRHGRTNHNKLALFTGWEDPPLAKEGIEDARNAGKILKEHGFQFDVVYSSWLYRAIQTAYYVLEEMDSLWVPLIQSWRLNERHYGALTGKSKMMVSNIYGEEQLKKWRKGHNVRPPPVSSYSFHYPGNDVRRTKYVEDLRISFSETLFRSIVEGKFSIHRKFPKSESLEDCMDRSIPFYTEKIVPEAVAKGKRVLIASHENAIRGILMHLCEIPPENMIDLNLPNGVPLVYSVRRKCISILEDGTGIDPIEKYDFGSAANYLFRPCELTEEDFNIKD